jgi:hypothetical protein
MNLAEALRFIEAHGNPYAQAYVAAIWDMPVASPEAEVQLRYILSNITHMRASGSKEARQAIKDFLA